MTEIAQIAQIAQEAPAPTFRTRHHPTDSDPRRVILPDPNAIITVSLDSLAVASVYAYCGATILRIEHFSSTTFKIEVQCTRAT